MLPCHGRGRGFESRPVRKNPYACRRDFLFMAFQVYILQSEQDGSFYKGYSENVFKRLQEHNEGLSQYTSAKLPWKLVYYETLSDKKTALIRERNLKKYSTERLITLINSPKNELKVG